MMPNHHITKPVLIGEIQDNGQFSVVWETPRLPWLAMPGLTSCQVPRI